ncbi:MAG TPA: hypothetical protein VHO29_04090 [Marmoricola sp.]|nr:hypothetical protein [Marmoricola sp.]
MKAVPDVKTPRRTDRQACAYCEATPAACSSLQWLSGRQCCEACSGDHDGGAA